MKIMKNMKYKNINETLKYILLSLVILLSSEVAAKTNPTENPYTDFDLAQVIRSIALIYTDDILDPEVEEFLNHQPEIIWEDNAYVYLWGMNVKTDNVYKTGKEILEKLVEDDKFYKYEQRPLELSFLNDYPLFETPDNIFLCKKHEDGCIKSMMENDSSLRVFITEYGFYKSRYLTFLNFSHFNQVADRRMESAIPSYRTITNGQKIYHIYLLQEFSRITKTTITTQLINEQKLLKNLLEHADTLIAKMIVLALLNENLEIINYAYQHNFTNLNTSNSTTLFKPLTISEMSLHNAMYEEHSKGMKMLFDWTSDYKNLNRKAKNPFGDALMRIFQFIVAKPNLTVNTQYNEIVKPLLRITKQPPKLFYKEYSNFKNSVHHDQIRNYIGHMLMSFTMPDYLTYQARVFDIDMKFQLMSLFIESESTNNLKKDNRFLSSYDQTPAFKQKNKWCYSGIAKMLPEYRCLTIY